MVLSKRTALALRVVLALLALPAISQTFRGGISGTVTDPSGAALVDAAVEAVNAATGLRRDTVSSSAGELISGSAVGRL